MPYVNVKLVKGQSTPEQKKQVIEGLTDLIVNIMGRERSLTVITLDELSDEQWAIGGKTINQRDNQRAVAFINIKVSKGTTSPEEMSKMMRAAKEMLSRILGNSEEANYFIVDELNPDAWGFDGYSMMERRNMEQ